MTSRHTSAKQPQRDRLASIADRWVKRVSNLIQRPPKVDSTPQWEETGLPDEWCAVAFRTDVLLETFDRATLRAAPFSRTYLAPPSPTREELQREALRRLRREHSSEASAEEGIERLHEILPRSRYAFDRDGIEQWYRRSARGETRAQEYVDAFETILASYPGQLVILCEVERHVERVQIDQKAGLREVERV